jgi:class 3 adenylate cyclase
LLLLGSCASQDYEKSTSKNAARLLAMAFEMLDIVKTVEDPVTHEPIQMRIGIHTGSIVAGKDSRVASMHAGWVNHPPGTAP